MSFCTLTLWSQIVSSSTIPSLVIRMSRVVVCSVWLPPVHRSVHVGYQWTFTPVNWFSKTCHSVRAQLMSILQAIPHATHSHTSVLGTPDCLVPSLVMCAHFFSADSVSHWKLSVCNISHFFHNFWSLHVCSFCLSVITYSTVHTLKLMPVLS